MLSIDKCRAILKKYGFNYTYNEIEEIRKFLDQIAEITYEKRNHLYKSIDRRTSK